MLSKTKTYYLWIFVSVVFLGLLLPFLVQQGMLVDGISNAAISSNLSNGIGAPFEPHYTQTVWPHFYEHPPLVFILQSYFFDVLGDGFFAEKIYGLVTAMTTAAGIVLCWKQATSESNYGWLPVLIWIITPLVFWSFNNNLLENTVSMFTIFSVWAGLKALNKNQLIWLFISAIFVVLAFLSKGLVGLFPLAIPVIYGVSKNGKTKIKSFSYSFLMVSFFSFFLG